MAEFEQEELLSAYLDDELSSDQRARIEQWIETDPQARQLFDELRALRSSIQALPRATVPTGLAERVLAEVRQTEPRAEAAVRPTASVESSDLPQSWFGSGGRAWRPLAWAGLATAVAIFIMMMGREREQEIALAPQPDAVPEKSLPLRYEFRAAPESDSTPVTDRLLMQPKTQMEEARDFAMPLGAPLADDAAANSYGFQTPPDEILMVRTRAASPAGVRYLRNVLAEETVEILADHQDALPRTPNAVSEPAAPSIAVAGTQQQLQQILERLKTSDGLVQVIDVSAVDSAAASVHALGRAPTVSPQVNSRRSVTAPTSGLTMQLSDESGQPPGDASAMPAQAAPAGKLRAVFILETADPVPGDTE